MRVGFDQMNGTYNVVSAGACTGDDGHDHADANRSAGGGRAVTRAHERDVHLRRGREPTEDAEVVHHAGATLGMDRTLQAVGIGVVIFVCVLIFTWSTPDPTAAAAIKASRAQAAALEQLDGLRKWMPGEDARLGKREPDHGSYIFEWYTDLGS